MAAKLDIQLLADRVLIAPVKKATKTPGGIVLPESACDDLPRGKVLAVGPGRQLENGDRTVMSVNVGEEVLYEPFGGAEIKLDGEKYRLLHESEILAVLGSK